MSQTTLSTFSRNKGLHDNGGGSGWSLEGKRSMMNYTKKSRPIGNNPPNIQPGAAKNLSVAKEKGIWQGKWTYT
jgi:hypothetical protein